MVVAAWAWALGRPAFDMDCLQSTMRSLCRPMSTSVDSSMLHNRTVRSSDPLITHSWLLLADNTGEER
jgi:hypothetical protein